MTSNQRLAAEPAPLRAAAWNVVAAAERMRMHWAESSIEVRNKDLWQPLHEAAEQLLDGRQ